jgi:hypothetical protein
MQDLLASALLALAVVTGRVPPAELDTRAPHELALAERPPPVEFVQVIPWQPAVVKALYKEIAVTKPQRQAAAKMAVKAVERREAGSTGWTFGKPPTQQWFNLTETGYCARFARQVYEAANGIAPGEWEFAALDAAGMARKLKAAGKLVQAGLDDLSTGDLLIDASAGPHGHVGIAALCRDGVWRVAENTSVKRRKDSMTGTILNTLVDFLGRRQARVRVYRP